MRRMFRKCGILLFWVFLWYGLCLGVDNRILLASPLETARALAVLLGEGSFYATVGVSLLRIGAGFLLGLAAGLCLAACSRRFPLAEELLSPAVGLAKAVPVASFVVLMLVWWGSSFLAVGICFLVVAPHIYISTLEGLKSTDKKLLEMAEVFRLARRDRFFYIYRPGLKPFWRGSMKVTLGMCWKSGVAAEVMGIPDHSIGEQLYLSKVYLDTGGIFAWTVVIILLSFLFEKMVLGLLERFLGWEPSCRGQKPRDGGREGKALELSAVTKGYQGRQVLQAVSAVYEPGGTYLLTEPSGSGKTTLLRILAGLTPPDRGSLSASPLCSMVFQEDRLCEEYSGLKNVELVTGDRAAAAEALGQRLEAEALERPCSELSGGMKRRVALVRALAADSDLLLLDEPFTGMDALTRRRAEEYIQTNRKGRTLVMADHREGSARNPGAE